MRKILYRLVPVHRPSSQPDIETIENIYNIIDKEKELYKLSKNQQQTFGGRGCARLLFIAL